MMPDWLKIVGLILAGAAVVTVGMLTLLHIALVVILGGIK